MLKSIGMVCLASLFIAGTLVSVCLTDSDLRAYWAFDEGSGKTVRDLSGNNNNGTIEGGVKWQMRAKYGSSLKFDGTSCWVVVPDVESLQITDQISIAAWVNPQPPAGGGSEEFIVSKYHHPVGQGYSMGIYKESPYFKLGIGGAIVVVHAADTKVPYGEWSHMAATFDGKEMKMYFSGDPCGSTQKSGKIDDWPGDLNIGNPSGHPGGSRAHLFHGLMDELKIWSKALSSEVVKLAMEPEKAVVEPLGKLAACWGNIRTGYSYPY